MPLVEANKVVVDVVLRVVWVLEDSVLLPAVPTSLLSLLAS